MTPFGECIPFDEIDIEDQAESPELIEAAEFLQKLARVGMSALLWEGEAAFPHELQRQAKRAEDAVKQLRHDIGDWAQERGVRF